MHRQGGSAPKQGAESGHTGFTGARVGTHGEPRGRNPVHPSGVGPLQDTPPAPVVAVVCTRGDLCYTIGVTHFCAITMKTDINHQLCFRGQSSPDCRGRLHYLSCSCPMRRIVCQSRRMLLARWSCGFPLCIQPISYPTQPLPPEALWIEPFVEKCVKINLIRA